MTKRLAAALCSAWLLAAHAGSSANYSNSPESINNGGTNASAASNTIRATVGQPALAASSSATYAIKSGLWHLGPGASLVPASIVKHTVTPSAGLHGSISPNTPQLVDHNTQTAFTVTPDAGYVATVGGTCGGFLVNDTFTTGAITQDCTVSATFVALVTYNVVLEGWQQVAPYVVTPATGSGTAVFNPVAHTLKLNLTYSGLGSAETGAHLHGPALRGANAAVLVPLAAGSPKTDEITLFPNEETMLANGQLYVNIHTTNYPNGEIRGQIDNVGATVLRDLTVQVIGPAGATGTVTGTSDGATVVSCSTSNCIIPVPHGKVLSLTATPTNGSTFVAWYGSCTGTGPCSVTMDASKPLQAYFDPPTTPTSADLSISQTFAPNPASVGKDLLVTLTVTNNGPGPANFVTITYHIPAWATFVWVQGSSPDCFIASNIVSCVTGTLAAGASTSRKVVIRPTLAAVVTSEALVNWPGSDPVSANGTNTQTLTVNATPAGTPIQRYRLYSDVTKEHHFTTDLNEYNVLGTYVGTWVQEGTVGKILNNPGPFGGVESIPYYRLYDTNTRWHHWTTDANEYYTLGYVYPGWNMEGVDGWILPTNVAGTTQLYRLNYPALGALHHWTIDANEYNTLITSFGWVGEPGAGFVVQ